MFETERLLYIDLHKTGCSHIRRLLHETVGGRKLGKHNRPEVMPTDKFVVGSVRNPWDWYVSLWAFGCKGAGAVRGRTTERFTGWYYREGLMSEMGLRRWSASPVIRTILHDVGKPVSRWREAYGSAGSPDHFRRWLRLIMDPRRRFDLGEGYGFSPLSGYAGLLTYRYMKLFSRDISSLFTRRCPAGPADLREFEESQSALRAIVHTERLERDLIAALELAGCEISPEQRERIIRGRGRKTNTSEHREAVHYYDEETQELVRRREQLIVQKYGYAGPGTPPRAALDRS